ncbi:MAG: hypothetical protein K2V38_10080 [Gemmataceae bacterium]|nr:hypothetical protein [Gemmataceae bacterium]
MRSEKRPRRDGGAYHERMLIWKAHSRLVDALAFSPDGRRLAVAGYHLACRLLDAATGERLWAAESNSAFGLSVAFGPGDTVLCRQSGLSVRSAATGEELRRFAEWCQSFALTPDRSIAFAARGHADTIRRHDLKTGETRGEVELDSGAVNRLAVSPDGALLAAVGCKRFYLLRADTLEVLASAAHRALSTGAFALALDPTGRLLAYSAGRMLFACAGASLREVACLTLDSRHFMDAAFTPDGRRLVAVSKEGTARVYDAATWELERSFDWEVGALRAVAIAPDGTRAAVAGDSGRVVVWDLDL